MVEQRFTQHIRVVLIPQAQIHYLPKKQSQASPEPATNIEKGCHKARRPTPAQTDSTVTAEATPPPAAPSLLTVPSAYAVSVPPGDRRKPGRGPHGRPRLYRHGGRRGRCSCLAPFPRNVAESGGVNKHRVRAPLSPAHLPLRERAPRARHALLAFPPSSYCPTTRWRGGAAR